MAYEEATNFARSSHTFYPLEIENYKDYYFGEGERRRYFDIKTVQCYWEGQESVMVMLLEKSSEVINKHLTNTNYLKDQLLANVAHDLKSPLDCMIQLLENSKYDDQIQNIKNNDNFILKNCYLLLSLTQDILD
jgi:signal transduction histidine kinase